MEYVMLNNGIEMPVVGFGTMNIFDEEECTRVIKEAYECGYRLFDCAEIYGNEDVVGRSLQNAGIPREKIFITTKIWFTHFEGEDVRQSVLRSMKHLKTDYLDMVMIHWPYGNTYHAYRELEKMYEEGLIRAIGISNYQESQWFDLVHFHKIVPVINQIKVTLRCQRQTMQRVMQDKGTLLQGYQVFGQEEVLPIYNDSQVQCIADKYNKTTRQIALKFLLQRGISVITRPMERQWMKDNLDLFDFQLTQGEMEYLKSFDVLEYNTKPSFDYQRTKSMLER